MISAEQQKIHTCLLENGFVPVDAKSHETIRNFKGANRLYEMTACLIVIWADELNTLYKIIDGFLCLANFYHDEKFYFSVDRPASVHDLQHIADVLYDISIKAGLDALSIECVEERFLDDYRNLSGYTVTVEGDDSKSEYVFSAESFLDLNGKVNEEKRRQLRKFSDKPAIALQAITKENISLCLDIENRWCESQDCDICSSFTGCAKKTPKNMVAIFDGCVYQGLFGYIDDVLSGYIIFEKAGDDSAYFYFAKTTVSNFSTYLYYNAIQRYLQNVRRINIGADLGIPGLRLFKRRLGPYQLQKKYLCTFIKEG